MHCPNLILVKPEDWLENAEPLVPDSESRKPDDWDDEMDGEWEPKKVPNPECEGIWFTHKITLIFIYLNLIKVDLVAARGSVQQRRIHFTR